MRHIGIDLHKNSFVACFLETDDRYRFATYGMTAEGLQGFRADLTQEDRVAVEVGQSAFFFYDQVHTAVADVVLVATHNFAVIAKSKKKTDRNDALTLARFLKLDCLPPSGWAAHSGSRLRGPCSSTACSSWLGPHVR